MSEVERDPQCTCDTDCDEHVCPYQAEINDDIEYQCNCCPHCTVECADNI